MPGQKYESECEEYSNILASEQIFLHVIFSLFLSMEAILVMFSNFGRGHIWLILAMKGAQMWPKSVRTWNIMGQDILRKNNRGVWVILQFNIQYILLVQIVEKVTNPLSYWLSEESSLSKHHVSLFLKLWAFIRKLLRFGRCFPRTQVEKKISGL